LKLVYVAGPYRAKSLYGIAKNIYRAWKVAKELWSNNIAVICPHTNTLWLSEPPNNIAPEHFLGGDLLMVRGCDAVLMLPKWSTSKGAIGEREFAWSNNIPIFYDTNEVIAWAKDKRTT